MQSRNKTGRYAVKNNKYNSVLIHNIPFLFTCDENDKLMYKRNHSIAIKNDMIAKIAPADTVKPDDYDLVYDAGLRGGTVVTPGLINTHAHPPMYLLRTAMIFDENRTIDETIAAMPRWEQAMTEDDFLTGAIGDLTEEQRQGITSTLSHYAVFEPIREAARQTGHHAICAVSAASNSHPANSPSLIRRILEKYPDDKSNIAVALHYLHKAGKKTLMEISRLVREYNLIFTCHFAESKHVAETCRKIHGMSETDVLEKYGLLNSNTVLSHVIHVTDAEIKRLVERNVGIVHLPTSNTIHKSGTFPLWKFFRQKGYHYIALGTDSVISKSRLDVLTEAYQTRLTHLYREHLKFGSLFKMLTVNGARVMHMNDRGRLLPGMKADIAFWKLKDRGFIPFDESDPFSLIGNLIAHNGRQARDLMIEGRFVISDRKHLLVDESRLLATLQERHMALRKRLKGEK